MRAMVLSDGTTYTGVEGCKIVELDDEAVKGLDVDQQIAEGKYETLEEFMGDEDWAANTRGLTPVLLLLNAEECAAIAKVRRQDDYEPGECADAQECGEHLEGYVELAVEEADLEP